MQPLQVNPRPQTVNKEIIDVQTKKEEQKEKYLIFHVEGGLGKNVASTAVVTHLHKKYPDRKIIVVCSFPEVYVNNEHIHRVYKISITPYFYNDYIKDKDTIVLRKEPYHENDHIMRKTSLFETWFNMYDIPYNKSEISPYLPMNALQQTWIQEWSRPKPIFLMQTNGGPLPKEMQPHNYAWTRDMPAMIANAVAQKASEKYHVIQVCRPTSYQIEGVERIENSMQSFQLFALLKASSKRFLIDSCLQHAAAALNMPSTVLWVGTSPKMFGYDLHTNICVKPPADRVKLVDSYLFDFDFNGNYHEFPYFEKDSMFDVPDILDSLDL